MHAFRAAFEARDARKALDLRGEEGERVVAGRRLPLRYGMRDAAIRSELAHDLAALLNTINLASIEDLSEFPQVEGSILNYGIGDTSGLTEERSARLVLADEILRVLERHEPRLVPGSVQIEPYVPEQSDENTICFMVRGELSSSPVNLGLEFIAEVQQGAKKVDIRKLATQ